MCVTHFFASTQFNWFFETERTHRHVSTCLECCIAPKQGSQKKNI